MLDDEIIDALWKPIEPTVYITRDQFMRGLAEWDIHMVTINDHPSFITMTRGTEFHFTSLGTGAPITLAMIRGVLEPIIAAHGCVTTRTPKEGADRQHRFNRILGFRVVGEDEFHTHYRLDAPCQL